MSEARLKKLNDLLRDEMGQILQEELDFDGDIFVTVMGVDVSPTLEHAAVKVSVFPEDKTEAVFKRLNGQIFDIQKKLNKRLVLRKVPKIRFEPDKTERKASQVEELLDKIEQ